MKDWGGLTSQLEREERKERDEIGADRLCFLCVSRRVSNRLLSLPTDICVNKQAKHGVRHSQPGKNLKVGSKRVKQASVYGVCVFGLE